MDSSAWIKKVVEGIPKFIEQMTNDDFTRVKYSYSGDVVDNKLANYVFLTKILFMSGLIDELTAVQKDIIYTNIIHNTNNEGEIHDKVISKRKLGYYISKAERHRIENIRRAETRQSFAALYLLGKKPKLPYQKLPKNKDEIENFISSYDWSNPWHAGSHFSHLVFFYQLNGIFFDENNDKLLKYAVQAVQKHQSREDGLWYSGEDVSLMQKINGGMKVLTGYDVIEYNDYSYAKKIIDTALAGTNDDEACSNFNIVYILYKASQKQPGYRVTEIESFLEERVMLYKQYYHEEKNGFSFYKSKANDVYYGKRVTKGLNEPDIHGTVLFIWGLSLIDKMLNLQTGFKIPIN